MTPLDSDVLAAATVWEAEDSDVPVPPPAALALRTDGFVIEGPAWPGSPLRTIIARLPIAEVGDVDLASPLGLRPALQIKGRDGARLRVHGAPRELAGVFDAWGALTGSTPTRALRTPGQRLLARIGTARVLSTIVTLLIAGIVAAVYASVPEAAFDLLRENRQRVDELRVGDCFAEPAQLAQNEAAAVSRVQLVPCAAPHDSEVIALADYPGDDVSYPGEDRVIEVSGGICVAALEELTTRRQRESIDVVFFYPTETSWGQGDRAIICAAYRPDGTPLQAPLTAGG